MIRIVKRRRTSRRSERKVSSKSDEALAAAKELVSADKRLEAIQLLTEANRAHRDRRIERRLVELRFDAFQRTAWSDSPAEWPDSVEDLFPGELIPEVNHEDLTVERVRSALWNHGSVLVRGLVGRDDAARLVGDIDSAFDAFDAKASGEERVDVDGWYAPVKMHGLDDGRRTSKPRVGHILAVESPPALFDLIEVLNEVGVGQLARDYLGEPPTILARKVSLRRMPHTASGAWHQDGAFMGVNLRSLNVWLALTHCGDDAPSLDVVGRRLDYIVPPNGPPHAPYAVTPEAAEQVGAGTIVRPIFDPGDALIFDHLCLHRTGRDKAMTNGRYAIETWLMAPSTYSAMTTEVDEGYQPDDQVPLVF